MSRAGGGFGTALGEFDTPAGCGGQQRPEDVYVSDSGKSSHAEVQSPLQVPTMRTDPGAEAAADLLENFAILDTGAPFGFPVSG